MIHRIRQRIARKVAHSLSKLDRRLKAWAAKHIRDEASGGSVSDREGLLARHGIDLQASADELDQQFSEREEGCLVRTYPERVVASESGRLNVDQQSTSGVAFHNDRPNYEDRNKTYQPVKVRGRATRRGHGLYHQMWLTSASYQRAWGTPLQGLVTGEWSVDPPDLQDPTPEQLDAAERRASKLQRNLLHNIAGGWKQYVTEWLYALVAGFVVHEPVYHGQGPDAGLLEKLSFIYPSSVDGWALDEAEQNLQAVRFRSAQDGGLYVIEARDLQIYSHLRMGLNLEGVSTLRSVTGWIQTVQLMQQLENLSKERLGVPWITAQQDGESMGNTEADKTLESILQDARAEESPVIKLPNGTTLQMHSAAGNEPDFSTPKEFAIKQIKQVLNAEGSLIAVNDTGAYAAREEASKDALQISGYLAGLLCDNLNGADNRPCTGVLKSTEKTYWGGPIQPGRYCQLSWSPGDERNPKRASRINEGLKSGALTPGPAVEGAYREEVGLPLSQDQERALADGPGDDDLVEGGGKDAEGADDDQPLAKLAASEQADAFELVASESRRPGERGITTEQMVQAGAVHLRAADVDPEKLADKQDRLEAQLARRLEQVATAHKKAYRDRVRSMAEQADGPAAKGAADRAKQEVRNTYLPRYQREARKVLEKAKDQGGQDLIRSYGKTIGQQTAIPTSRDIATIIDDEADQIGREAFQRQQGRFDERTNAMLSGDTAKKLEKLAGSTWAAMAGKTVSKPYNLGRQAVVEKTAQKTRQMNPSRPVELIAERSSVLDGKTCGPCEDLDGERAMLGSDRYGVISPPNQCDGGGRCRCIFSFILPDERGFDAAVEEIKAAS